MTVPHGPSPRAREFINRGGPIRPPNWDSESTAGMPPNALYSQYQFSTVGLVTWHFVSRFLMAPQRSWRGTAPTSRQFRPSRIRHTEQCWVDQGSIDVSPDRC